LLGPIAILALAFLGIGIGKTKNKIDFA